MRKTGEDHFTWVIVAGVGGGSGKIPEEQGFFRGTIIGVRFTHGVGIDTQTLDVFGLISAGRGVEITVRRP